MSNYYAFGDGEESADFLFLESYQPANGRELTRWELVSKFGTTANGALAFKADYRDYVSTRIKDVYVDPWNYRLVFTTESGAVYKFSFAAPYGRADYRKIVDNFHELCRRAGIDIDV